MPRPYLRRPGSRPPGQPRKTWEQKRAAGTLQQGRERAYAARDQAAAHPRLTAVPPGSDRNGIRVDPSLVLTHEQEDRVIEGLSEEAADIAWWLLQHIWNWSRQDQITLRAFATMAARVKALERRPKRAVQRELSEARQMLVLLSQQLELEPIDIVAAMQAHYPR